MTARPPLPSALGELPFTRTSGLSGGLSSSRLRAADLRSPFHGVNQSLLISEELGWRCRSYLERMRPGNVFSHATAAQLYQLPLPLYLDVDRVHVSAPAGVRPPTGRGVVGHELASGLWRSSELIRHDHRGGHLFALPIAAPEVVWAQLARLLDPIDLVALGDAILTGAEPLGSAPGLAEITRAWSPRRGSAAMAAALPKLRRGPLSRPESLLRVQIAAAGIPEPALNVVVRASDGRGLTMADLVWPEFRVLVEYEGDGHRTSRGKFRSDITRVEEYADGDWFALRAQADDIFSDPNPFLRRLGRRLERRGWRSSRELRQVAGARR